MRLLILTLLAVAVVAKPGVRCPRPIPGLRNVLPYTLPVPGDCNKYYKCGSDGEAVELSCPANEEFHPVERTCGAPTGRCHSVQVLPVPVPTPAVRIHDHLCIGKAEGERVATDMCNSFVFCEGGVGYMRSCGSGLLFNTNAGYCDAAANVLCRELIGPPQGSSPDCQGREGAMLANPYDCSSFYVCQHNAALLYYCDNGLFYDSAIGGCNWRENVRCVPADLPTDPNIPVGTIEFQGYYNLISRIVTDIILFLTPFPTGLPRP